jgi:hypothetical protein
VGDQPERFRSRVENRGWWSSTAAQGGFSADHPSGIGGIAASEWTRPKPGWVFRSMKTTPAPGSKWAAVREDLADQGNVTRPGPPPVRPNQPLASSASSVRQARRA